MTDRREIYHWKCDRPAAFYALEKEQVVGQYIGMDTALKLLLKDFFKSDSFTVRPAGGQGNHLTYLAYYDNSTFFLRLENGPDGDDYMNIETEVLNKIQALGVPSPKVYSVDVTRSEYPFAYQILEFVEYPDLNKWYKEGSLHLLPIAKKIGESIARWQSIHPDGYGPFDPESLQEEGKLVGFHTAYQDYFFLNWNKHLEFLVHSKFLTPHEAGQIQQLVKENQKYLQLRKGCLVHKDLALWNILGDEKEIKAFIDWDDTISGDPMDDISLLACFHNGEVINSALQGYESIRSLPEYFLQRFWLHLLRNMVVKAVIRVGAGYFERKDDFFLIETDTTGLNLKAFTYERILSAIDGLKNKIQISDL